jgi:hypothetical protein
LLVLTASSLAGEEPVATLLDAVDILSKKRDRDHVPRTTLQLVQRLTPGVEMERIVASWCCGSTFREIHRSMSTQMRRTSACGGIVCAFGNSIVITGTF